ncbi:hypothetical protein I6F65_10045 [Pseudoalteromonas sp. SWXJZ94C]|uniref:hypothetical protein n=1 Tax=unclassified Pseudoalteromonas TaxID=194690 RepID=UPI00140A0F27|nr:MULTISPECIES: hypothetical protein [unclassified Pseudoalteromonas]MBH0057305.1 hypothetical protein [Pseudoalteromonas sp. SWXJZ94C]
MDDKMDTARTILNITSSIEKIEKDKNELFIILWIGLGFLFSVLMEKFLVSWIVAITIAAVYAYGFYKKDELNNLKKSKSYYLQILNPHMQPKNK